MATAAVRIDPEFRKRGVAGDRPFAVAGETLLRRPLRLRPPVRPSARQPVRPTARSVPFRAWPPHERVLLAEHARRWMLFTRFSFVSPHTTTPPPPFNDKFRLSKFPKKLSSLPPTVPVLESTVSPVTFLPYSTAVSLDVFRRSRKSKRIIQRFETVRCSDGACRTFTT